MSSKEYFDNIARQWEAMRQDFFSETVREKALSAAEVRSGMIAADIGAGNGFITRGLVRKGLRVIAVDQSEKMLAEMRRTFKKTEKIDYRVGIAEKLPITDKEVDSVFANMFLHHVETPRLAIKEMVRILKPGGKLVITDLDEHQFEFLRTEQHDRWLGFDREAIREWFAEAALRNIKVDGVGEDCRAGSRAGDDYAAISIFVASGEK